MKDALKFVKGAVAKKDFVSALKHVHIQDGVIQAFNGSIALSSPIAFKHNLTPIAADFIKAVEKCKDEPKISVTKGGKLKVSEGSFKVFVKVTEEVYPAVQPVGTLYDCDSNLLECFESLHPFIGTDAAKPWSMGIIIRDGYAYATNNVVLACYTKPVKFPFNIVIPKNAVDEILRLKQEVIQIQMDEKSATFHFNDSRWMRTNLIACNAPDFYPIFSKCSFDQKELQAIPEDLYERVDNLKPFLHPKIPTLIFRQDGVFTDQDDEGASDTEYSFPLGVFRFEPLQKVLLTATAWNLNYYPAPCPFVGENVSGVIIGQKVRTDAV